MLVLVDKWELIGNSDVPADCFNNVRQFIYIYVIEFLNDGGRGQVFWKILEIFLWFCGGNRRGIRNSTLSKALLNGGLFHRHPALVKKQISI